MRQRPVARPSPVDCVRSDSAPALPANGVLTCQRPSRATYTTMRSSASAGRCRPVGLPRQALPPQAPAALERRLADALIDVLVSKSP